MTDRPILFSAPMVRAIIAEAKQPGTGKTQTRRVLRVEVPPSPGDSVNANNTVRHAAPYLDAYNRTSKWCWWTRDDRCCLPQFDVGYAVSDRLWVRETVARDGGNGWRYYATDDVHELRKKVPAIYMPRIASRLTLTVTNVRVERLQDISEADTEAEGVEFATRPFGDWSLIDCPWPLKRNASDQPPAAIKFAYLWNTINGERAGASWVDNPWVVAITFKPVLCNIDAMDAIAA